jgi:uncharacterized membrane protein YtjA (UPF0391 family)
VGVGPKFCDAPSPTAFGIERHTMLWWALVFLIVALIAGALGFSGIVGASTSIAWILFVVFLVLFAISLIANAVRGRTPPV